MVSEHNGTKDGLSRVTAATYQEQYPDLGKNPATVKKDAKRAGYPSKVCHSAKEILRRTQPAKGCSMSLADNLVEQGHDEKRVFEVTAKAAEVFQGILDLGVGYATSARWLPSSERRACRATSS